MAEMEPIENQVRRDRIAASRRPDLKFPLGTLNIIDGQAYAYSGQVNGGASADATLLSFVTGPEVLRGTFQFTYAPDSYQETDVRLKVTFNNTIVVQYWDTQDVRQGGDPHTSIPLIIPPYTRVNTIAYMNGGAQLICSTFVGEVV